MRMVDLPESGTSSWHIRSGSPTVALVLSQQEVLASQLGSGDSADFALDQTPLEADAEIPSELAGRSQLMVVEVRPDSLTSLRRIEKLRAQYPKLPIIAAVRDASISAMRTLLRAGVSDVLTLPLLRRELDAIIARLRGEMAAGAPQAEGKLVTVIKSVGGGGASSILTQSATLYADIEASRGREVCLFDLDLQCGNAATYLGLAPTLTVADLLDAGARLDATVLRSVGANAARTLAVMAAPLDMMPLEAVDTEQVCAMVDLAKREYGTVFVDLPSDWTNWSLSLVAQSDLVLFVVDLTIASLRQAQRQLALLDKLGVAQDSVQIVVNRIEKRIFRQIDLRDAEKVLNRPAHFTVANDFALMMTALNQGIPIGDIKSKSAIGRDLRKLIDSIDMLFGRG